MMRVVRVVVHAPVTSFRHPFFVTGRQPTFDVPPPSTIHGHCASALGAWPDPQQFFFGIHFSYRSRGRDLEHQHITEALGSSRLRIPVSGGEARATTGVTVQPVVRDFLFDVRMTLYLPPALADAFRRPAYPVIIGRSQDLAEVVAVEEIELARSDRVRLEHTLLPQSARRCVRLGTTVLLSRYIEPPPDRHVSFAQYISLHEPVFLGGDPAPARAFVRVQGFELDDLWADPGITDEEGYPRGVWIHRLVGSA